MKKSKLEDIVETIEGVEDVINSIRLELDELEDEILDDMAFGALSELERLKDSLNIQLQFGSED